jgi:hypothetical protein
MQMTKVKMCNGKGKMVYRPGVTLPKMLTSNPIHGSERLGWIGYDDVSNVYTRSQPGIKRPLMQCLECGRRMVASSRTCEDGCCIYYSIPAHKPKGWWKKNKKRKK